MKLTTELVKSFERDQQEHGTKTALYNLLWLKATEDLKDLGITRIRTEEARNTPRRHRAA